MRKLFLIFIKRVIDWLNCKQDWSEHTLATVKIANKNSIFYMLFLFPSISPHIFICHIFLQIKRYNKTMMKGVLSHKMSHFLVFTLFNIQLELSILKKPYLSCKNIDFAISTRWWCCFWPFASFMDHKI